MSYFCKPKFVSQKIIDDKLYIYCPYNEKIIRKFKYRGGVWKSSAWEFNSIDQEKISSILRETYGEDGTEHKIEYVSLKLSGDNTTSYNNLMIAGRIIAARKERDSRVILEKNTIVLSGMYYGSGGSMKYPTLKGEDVVLLVRYIPKNMLDSIKKDYETNLDYEIDLDDCNKMAELLTEKPQENIKEIEGDNYEEKYNKLLAEHNALIKKMAELKNLINNI